MHRQLPLGVHQLPLSVRQPLRSVRQPMHKSLRHALQLGKLPLRLLTLKSDSVSSSDLVLLYERDFANSRTRVCPQGQCIVSRSSAFVSHCTGPFVTQASRHYSG